MKFIPCAWRLVKSGGGGEEWRCGGAEVFTFRAIEEEQAYFGELSRAVEGRPEILR